MRKRILVLAALTVLTACGTGSQAPTLKADVPRAVPAKDAPVGPLATAMTRFGYDLTRTAGDPKANWVVSPLSIAYAFGMARAGAGGATAAELDKAFGFPASGTDEAFNAISRQIVTAEVPPARTDTRDKDGRPLPPVVCVGNGVFTQDKLAIGQPFLHTLAAQYGAGVHPVDFGSPKAKDVIDAWVRAQTAGRITHLFDQLPPSTKLVLANAVYLRAAWDRDFEARQPGTFTRADGSTVQVPMISQQIGLRYASGKDWQAVDVPYAGGKLAMRIMVPAPGGSPDALLAPDVMAAAAAGMRPARVGIEMPAWDFSTDLSLVEPLRKLGVHAAFDQSADFSAIHPGLYVEQAVHRATITVDQWGTEAAAVTGLVMPLSEPAPPDFVVRADRPFAFVIVDTATGVPLFVGHVADPTAKG